MFKRLGLGPKLLLSYLFMALLVALTGIAGVRFTRAMNHQGVVLAEQLTPQVDATMEVRLAALRAHLRLEEILSGDTSEDVGQVWASFEEARWYVDALLHGGKNREGVYQAVTDPAVRERLERVRERLVAIEAAGRTRVEHRAEGSAPGSKADDAFDAEFARFEAVADDAEGLLQQTIEREVATLRSDGAEYLWWLSLAALLAVILSVIIGLVFARSITRPVVEVATLSGRIAEGNLVVEREELEDDERADEIGVLRKAFLRMRENLRRAMENMQRGAGDLAANSAQVTATARQYSASAQQQATAVAEVSTTVAEIRQTSEAAAVAARQVEQAAEQAVASGRRGLDAITQAVRMTEVVGSRVEAIASRILQLSEKNLQIGEIVESVNDLAEQSNLLAVNASIEAAKAGEGGRGFGVVASEVRSLAEQSKRATHQIRSILTEIQKATEGLVMAAEEGTKRSQDGRGAIESVRTVVEELAAVLDQSTDRARQIAGAASQQAAGIGQIAQAIEDVRKSGEDNLSGVRQLEAAAAALAEVGGRMRALAGEYRLTRSA
ncbi:MAG: methyl-accepting chemotaxis protein [Deltaproteobacteria bacterium]|nr:methyl-accepting chemotaxis protein [Deltaproteobacteria bacterium]